MKILIIEDESDLLASICTFLSKEKFNCETAKNYSEAIEKVSLYAYDCIVLDINLPGGSGLDILKELKRTNKADGVIIISAKDSAEDKILGLKQGADDYLAKPFYMPELRARLDAVIRRRSFGGTDLLSVGKLRVELQKRRLKVNNKPIELTRKEYDLLVYLISNLDKVIPKDALAEHLWGDDIDMANNFDFIYAHVKNLRRKLSDAGCPDYIRSVYGVGYMLTLE